ncbi:polyisoprenoid-binding protein [Brevibacterium sp. 5221]|uniref:Polyisoprenoid-binding protein n=1 Tax=Brevibacterium rongguiense TaxID=2695267 RepID=A0A6N9H670_9MICO|nr:YceI family protein [Brevibacterium rongguiense]MYM19433.1 polyisoprenoid-binding protein [Brevibacterium rongguiense]
MSTLPTGLTAGTWNIDGAHSDFAFTARHAGVSKVRGNIYGIEGVLEIAEDFTASSVRASADAATVSTANEQRDEHLKSGDFFLASEHPQITFASTAITGVEGPEFTLEGTLTLRGVERPVSFKAEFNGANEDPYGNTVAGFSATTAISRKDFGMSFDAKLPGGDLLVSDKIQLAIEIEAVKQA